MKIKRSLSGKKLILYRFNLIFKSIFIFLIFAIVGILLTIFVFFKVQNIECIGDSQYAEKEIISASNLKVGKNLFLFNTKKSAKSIEEKLPYVENVKIIRKVPDKLIIDIKRAKNYLSFEIDGKIIILSDRFKVLDISNDNVDETIKVKGINLKHFEIGKNVVFNEGDNESNFIDLLNLLKEKGLINNIKKIDFSDSIGVIINYDNRIDIKLGIFEKVDYKLRTAKELIDHKISSFENGVLDLSMLPNDNRSYFNSNN